MTNLSRTAAETIDSIINSMQAEGVPLDDIEELTELIEGELEENFPNEYTNRYSIRTYIQTLLS